MTLNTAQIGSLATSIDIDAAPNVVWKALTENIGEWWPDAFFAGGEEGKRRYTLDARVGGQMYESWDNGGGVVWGNVVAVDPGRRLQVLGCVFPDFGGPNFGFGTWEFEALEGGGTRLGFSESTMGRVSTDGVQEKDMGWNFLWSTLKAYVEGNPAPDWPA